MKITIDPTATPQIWHLTDTAPVLEIYANESFDTSNGETVLAGNFDLGDCYRKVQLSVAGNVLSFPAITDFDTNEDSLTNQQGTYSAYIRVANREPIPWLLDFPVAPIMVQGATSVSWTTLRIHAAGVRARRSNDVYTKQETENAIAAAGLKYGYAAKGRTPMTAGLAAVSESRVKADSIIVVSNFGPGMLGSPTVAAVSAGVGFTIESSNADEGEISWVLYAA